jgi:ABC-type glycerol-3-phosphate transport system substrate-binding protein
MKKLSKHFTAAAALLSLLSLTLSGCNGAVKPASSDAPDVTGVQPEKIAFENVYAETQLPVEFHGYGNSVLCAGERIYYSTTLRSEGEPGGGDAAAETQKLISCDLGGGDEKIHWEQTTEPDDGASAVQNTQLYAFDADADGNLWLVVPEIVPDDSGEQESKTRLVKLAPDGTEIFSTDMSLPESAQSNVIYGAGLEHDAAGNIYLHIQDIYVFSADGEYAFALKEPLGGIQSMTATNDGGMIYITLDTTGAAASYVAKPIDFAAKSAGAAINLGISGYFYNTARGSGEYLFYYRHQSGIYGAKLDTASGAFTGVKVVDFINSDISNDDSGGFETIDGGGFIRTATDYRITGAVTRLFRLTEDKNATLEGKTVITLGSAYGGDPYVTKFNKASRTTRIIVKDYSEYITPGDFNAGQAQLDLDILAGRVPDIISVRGQVSKYASKGLLADLTPFLDSGEHGISREDLFENILTASSTNGKLYQIIPRFNIVTLAGKQSILGARESITPAELAAIADARPDAVIMQTTTSSDWLSNAVWLGMSNYVDWEAGTCAFNTQEFIDTLEFSKRFPKEIDYNALFLDQDAYMAYYRDLETAYTDGRTLLISAYIYPRTARNMDFLFGEKAALIGYPTAGTSGSVIMSSGGYAISASSPNKDAAWEFICGAIDLAGETSSGMFSGTPLDKRKFEETLQLEMLPLEDRDFTNGVDVTRADASGGMQGWTMSSVDDIDKTDPFYENYPLTQEEADRVRRVIEGAYVVALSDEQISKIITEEAEAFRAGAKTAEETANIIQSRASLYVSETR